MNLIEHIKDLKNVDYVELQCDQCNAYYKRKVRDIKTSLKKNITRQLCHNCVRHDKQGSIQHCKQCNSEYYVTLGNFKSKFCSSSCSAKYNNTRRNKPHNTKIDVVSTMSLITRKCVKGKITKKCIYCNKEHTGYNNYQQRRKFCSLECSAKYKREQAWLPKREAIERGETNLSDNIECNNSYFKRYLIEQYSAKCMRCGWSETNTFTNRIPIEIEHKDGDCTNNNLSNLELLCPNCHSLTATYKGANKRDGGSKRYQMWKTYFK